MKIRTSDEVPTKGEKKRRHSIGDRNSYHVSYILYTILRYEIARNCSRFKEWKIYNEILSQKDVLIVERVN